MNPLIWSFEFLFYILLLISAAVSTAYCVSLLTAVSHLKMIFGTSIAVYIILVVNRDYDFYGLIFIGQIVTILILVLYMYNQGNIRMESVTEHGDRNRFLLSANTYSNFVFFANMSIFYLYQRYRNKITFVLLIVLPIIFIFLILNIASRQGLIILVLINLIYWIFILGTGRSLFRKIFFSAAVLLLLIFGYNKYYKGSYLAWRAEMHIQHGESRVDLIKKGFEIFADQPLLGIGPGQTMFFTKDGLYTHNAYSEIAATQGIIGLILLLLLYTYPIFEAISLFKYSRIDPVYLKLNLLFFFSFMFFNMFRAFYFFPGLMLFFFVIVSFQKSLKEKMLII